RQARMHEGLLDERGFDTQRLPGVPLASKTPREPSHSPEENPRPQPDVNRNTLSPWCCGRALLGQRRPPRPRLARNQLQLAHELADELLADLLAAADQRGVEAPVSVFLIVRLEQCLDLQLEHFPPLFCLALRP